MEDQIYPLEAHIVIIVVWVGCQYLAIILDHGGGPRVAITTVQVGSSYAAIIVVWVRGQYLAKKWSMGEAHM
jgi:hypothetical protein